MIPVILSGGSGTRLWPISRTKFPKQFNSLFSEPLQSSTLKRLARFGQPMIVTSKVLRDFTEKKAKDAGFPHLNVIYEPFGRNTAPATALLCRWLELQGMSQCIVGTFPADHLIENEDEFAAAIELAHQSAKNKKIVTLGLKPTRPETGYGYIQTQPHALEFNQKFSSHEVIKFHEKPSLDTAKLFLSQGSFYWNAGIFIFQVDLMIDLFKKYQPQIWSGISTLKSDLSNLSEIYQGLPSVSLDYAIIEKLTGNELLCVPCNPGWSDVGCWDAIAEVYARGGEGAKELSKQTIEVNSKNNFVLPHGGKKYAFVGADDLIVIDTQDALLISRRGHSQDVKRVVDRLKAENSRLPDEHTFEERPWGRFDILKESVHFKSKLIEVDAGSQLSYQSHAHREEHWIVTAGEGIIVLNDEEFVVKKGSYMKIPQGAKHRIKNTGNKSLEFIEVQIGSYFGEDDIVRYQDDYKRL